MEEKKESKKRNLNKIFVPVAAIVTVCMLTIATTQAMPVTVTNWPGLMTLVQKQVSQFLSNKIQQVWEKELGEKLKAGMMKVDNVTGAFKDFSGSINEFSSKNVPALMGSTVSGALNTQQVTQNLVGAADSILKTPMKVGQDVTTSMQQATNVASLIGGFPKPDPKTLSEPQKIGQALDGAIIQARQLSYLKATQVGGVANDVKKQLQSLNGAAIDGGTSDQAVKDLAKIMLMRLKLEAETLELMAIAEQRNALTPR